MTKVDQLKDFIAWMWAFGSPVVKDGKIVVGDDASVEAVIWYKKLYDEKLIAPDVNRFDARALFAQGKVGFYEDAIGGKGAVVKQATDKTLKDSIAPAARPVTKTGDKPAVAWGHIAVVVDGEGADTAADFAKFATSDKAAVLGCFKDVSLPPTTTVRARRPGGYLRQVHDGVHGEDHQDRDTPARCGPSPSTVRWSRSSPRAFSRSSSAKRRAKDALTKAREDIGSWADRHAANAGPAAPARCRHRPG